MPSDRRPLISGNWKMNLNHFEAIQTVQKLAYLVGKDDLDDVDVSIHPPFTDIRSVQTVIDADKLRLRRSARSTATGRTRARSPARSSPLFLAKLDVSYVIAGHSERRELFGETDEMVAKKVAAIQRHGMTPIMCVGETLDEREAGETEDKVLGQVRAALAGLDGRAGRRAGDRLRADLGDRHRPHGDGRRRPGRCARRSADASPSSPASRPPQAVRIQYGGSVKAANIAELMAQPDIDGALVGGASLDPDEFARICKLGSLDRRESGHWNIPPGLFEHSEQCRLTGR